ncbi:MAG TPA: PTS sugar transporter subunit IIA [Gemmatimonadales bacterium]|nr:PTS sugar transporter subunit IIA [Gemmatimonadales bacterium]
MDELLTLKQIAQHLQVSERTVFRLLEHGELPGLKVGGQWRFRRRVVDYWLDLRMDRMASVEVFDAAPEASSSRPLSDALAPENALVVIPPGSRRDVIESFIGAIALPEAVDADEVVNRVWAREELSSTALREGVALLHTSRWETRTLSHGNLFAVGRLAEATDFGALDGQPTDHLFLLLAGSAPQHLGLLARATRLCREPGFLAGLRAAASAHAVMRLIRHTEDRLRPIDPAVD